MSGFLNLNKRLQLFTLFPNWQWGLQNIYCCSVLFSPSLSVAKSWLDLETVGTNRQILMAISGTSVSDDWYLVALEWWQVWSQLLLLIPTSKHFLNISQLLLFLRILIEFWWYFWMNFSLGLCWCLCGCDDCTTSHTLRMTWTLA